MCVTHAFERSRARRGMNECVRRVPSPPVPVGKLKSYIMVLLRVSIIIMIRYLCIHSGTAVNIDMISRNIVFLRARYGMDLQLGLSSPFL